MSAIAARVFGPGLTSTGVPGHLRLTVGGLSVTYSDTEQKVALADVDLRQTGSNGDDLIVSWRAGGATWAAHVLASPMAARLLTQLRAAGVSEGQSVYAKQRQQRRYAFVGWTLMVGVLCLPLALAGWLFAEADRIGAWIVEHISLAAEVDLGRASFEVMRAEVKLRDGEPQHAVVQQLGQRLTVGSRYAYEFHVVADPTVNAYALPGGIVIVHDGLIAFTSRPEELAGVLAHEIQHVEQRHGLLGVIRDLGLSAGLRILTGQLGNNAAAGVAMQLTHLRFSRDAEREADRQGFAALVGHDIDPAGMSAFFQRLAQTQQSVLAAYLSTHPLSEERASELSAQRLALRGKSFTPLNFGPWPPPS